MSIRLEGKSLAQHIEHQLTEKIKQYKQSGLGQPRLAIVQVGEDAASSKYVQMKRLACERAEILTEYHHFHALNERSIDALDVLLDDLNQNRAIHGILIQHPLPQGFETRYFFDKIVSKKDVDGLSSINFGRMVMNQGSYLPATPAAIIALLDHYQLSVQGLHAVVVGRSPILGRPIAELLLNRDATVTICHSKTEALSDYIQKADLLVAAMGQCHGIKNTWIKDNAIVIDAGFHPSKNSGDIDLTGLASRVRAYTPVPGGVGPLTIAMLMKNTMLAFEHQLKGI